MKGLNRSKPTIPRRGAYNRVKAAKASSRFGSTSLQRIVGAWLLAGCHLFLFSQPLTAADSFVTFESGQVRPLAMTPDGKRLVAVNTPDNRLELFDITDSGLTPAGSVTVGLEPVAVAIHDNEAWVVNHLSDSVSIVDIGRKTPRVTRTLLVGDEPRDIVFAGPHANRAFITTAHRGQNVPYDPQFTTPGVGRADVWVFDTDKLSEDHLLIGAPLTILSLFTDTPRALAVSEDGRTVYAAGFHTGNQTTTIHENAVCDGGQDALPCKPFSIFEPVPVVEYEAEAPGGLPAPNTTASGVPAVETGLIVKYNGNHWVDELERNWDSMVRFNLPDKDVFMIDAMGAVPKVTGSYAHVGTILFNMVVNPVNGKVYVSNTDAINEVRFEGSRPVNSDITTVQGRLHQARITVIDNKGAVTPRHLNKHINYDLRPAVSGTKEKSLATPTEMAVTNDGKTFYVAAFGSSKVGIFKTSALENDSFQPDSSSHITVSGGGPSGLVLDEHRKRLYVLTRFDNGISVINTAKKAEVAHYGMFNPEPAKVVNGRRFLYDAFYTSSNGEASCASCHIFGDLDSLAWDLGDPLGQFLNDPGPFTPLGPFGDTGGLEPIYHPMKGPMTTQSLRGLADSGPMHWRGDRTGGNDAPSVQPDSGSYDEAAGFKKFNPAFVGLIGRNSELPAEEMQAFTDFMLEVTYPPNPVRNLDNSLTAKQTAGRDFFFNPPSLVGLTCEQCHRTDDSQNFFGTDGNQSFTAQQQLTKIPHLRNLYQKVGMFGMPVVPSVRGPGVDLDPRNEHMGDQVRGVGFLHDGSIDTLLRFNRGTAFEFASGEERAQVEDYQLAFNSKLAPIVGQQITLDNKNKAEVAARVELFISRAAVGECDLVVKGVVSGVERGWYRKSNGRFQSDKSDEAPLNQDDLIAIATRPKKGSLTYTCVPPGSGVRIGIDRDENGIYDGDEIM